MNADVRVRLANGAKLPSNDPIIDTLSSVKIELFHRWKHYLNAGLHFLCSRKCVCDSSYFNRKKLTECGQLFDRIVSRCRFNGRLSGDAFGSRIRSKKLFYSRAMNEYTSIRPEKRKQKPPPAQCSFCTA